METIVAAIDEVGAKRMTVRMPASPPSTYFTLASMQDQNSYGPGIAASATACIWEDGQFVQLGALMSGAYRTAIDWTTLFVGVIGSLGGIVISAWFLAASSHRGGEPVADFSEAELTAYSIAMLVSFFGALVPDAEPWGSLSCKCLRADPLRSPHRTQTRTGNSNPPSPLQ